MLLRANAPSLSLSPPYPYVTYFCLGRLLLYWSRVNIISSSADLLSTPFACEGWDWSCPTKGNITKVIVELGESRP